LRAQLDRRPSQSAFAELQAQDFFSYLFIWHLSLHHFPHTLFHLSDKVLVSTKNLFSKSSKIGS
jgi:hypothetical protein